MAWLMKRGSVYYIRYCIGNKKRKVSTDTDNYQLAKEKLRQFEAAQARGDVSPLFAAAPALLEALCLANKCLELTGRSGYTRLPAAKQIHEAIESATGWVMTSSEVDHGDGGGGPRTVGNALSRVLGHFIFDEQADFEQAIGNTARKHIFHDLRVLNDWLKVMGYGSYL